MRYNSFLEIKDSVSPFLYTLVNLTTDLYVLSSSFIIFFSSSISILPVPLSTFKQFEMFKYPLDAKRIMNVISGKLMNSIPNFKGFAAVSDKTNRKSNSSGT